MGKDSTFSFVVFGQSWGKTEGANRRYEAFVHLVGISSCSRGLHGRQIPFYFIIAGSFCVIGGLAAKDWLWNRTNDSLIQSNSDSDYKSERNQSNAGFVDICILSPPASLLCTWFVNTKKTPENALPLCLVC